MMRTAVFTAGIMTGLAGAAAAALAMNTIFTDPSATHKVSRTAHKAAGAVSNAAYDAANTIDKMIQ